MAGHEIEAGATQRVGWGRKVAPALVAPAAIAALAALAVSGGANAGTATGTFTVQATISSACLVTANLLNFGPYSPTASTALTGQTTINVNCTSGSPFTAALNVGSGGGAFTGRTLLSGSNTLTYNLYTNAALTQVWGDGTGSTLTVAGTGSGLLTSTPLTVYGSIPISQDKPVGTYTSLITVTISY
jgi:spore coat protein U-like protein